MEHRQQRPARHGKLGHEIAAVLLFKAVVLSLIWVVFFSNPPTPDPDPQTTAAHLMGGGHSSTQLLPGTRHD
ncbi:MAG: hypothetical protein KGL13_06850 [Gammaproteobacteria bacterium]|nr:hypothetical protein [Gammaproteobacteria bacterium]MDE2346169.1 hypothetical protein [Gammaproteobacteria bacterium]